MGLPLVTLHRLLTAAGVVNLVDPNEAYRRWLSAQGRAATVPPNVSVKLLIVDDHPLFRQGVRFALAAYDDVTVVTEAPNGEEALVWLTGAAPNSGAECRAGRS